jgi:hypothetical protein
MDIITQLIHNSQIKTELNVMYDNQKVGTQKIIIDIDNKTVLIDRIYVDDYSVKVTCMNLPLYYDYIKKGLPDGWKLSMTRLWGWGVPALQMYWFALKFIGESDMFLNLKNTLERSLEESGEKVSGCDEEYAMIIEAINDIMCSRSRICFKKNIILL